MERSIPCCGRALKVVDLRGLAIAESVAVKAAAFGDPYQAPVSVSGSRLEGDDARAAQMTESLYREAVRRFNDWDAAAHSTPSIHGGRCCYLPLGIALYDFGAQLIAAREMRTEWYQS